LLVIGETNYMLVTLELFHSIYFLVEWLYSSIFFSSHYFYSVLLSCGLLKANLDFTKASLSNSFDDVIFIELSIFSFWNFWRLSYPKAITIFNRIIDIKVCWNTLICTFSSWFHWTIICSVIRFKRSISHIEISNTILNSLFLFWALSSFISWRWPSTSIEVIIIFVYTASISHDIKYLI